MDRKKKFLKLPRKTLVILKDLEKKSFLTVLEQGELGGLFHQL